MHNIERSFVIGLSYTPFACVYVCNFEPGNFTGWGSEGVNALFLAYFYFSVLFFNTSECVYLIVLTELLVCMND